MKIKVLLHTINPSQLALNAFVFSYGEIVLCISMSPTYFTTILYRWQRNSLSRSCVHLHGYTKQKKSRIHKMRVELDAAKSNKIFAHHFHCRSRTPVYSLFSHCRTFFTEDLKFPTSCSSINAVEHSPFREGRPI